MLEPGKSSVVTYLPNGKQPRHLGQLGHVNQLVYDWINPGGPNTMACVLQVPPDLRTDALNPGRIVQIYRGGQVVWDGKLMEPVPDPAGWQITATGVGLQGTDFVAYYASNPWGNSENEPINRAIARGLRWTNPGGLLTAPFTGGGIPGSIWWEQQPDPASMNITDLLNSFCTKGGLTWYVSTGPAPDDSTITNYYGNNTLSVYNLPATTKANVTNYLVASTPIARTLGGDFNSLWLRYQISEDAKTQAATFGTRNVTNAQSIAQHQPMEAYDDLSSAGTQTTAAVDAAGNSILNRYQRAAFGGPFTVRWGELLNKGGAPVDLGMDMCGSMCQVIVADADFGGEVVPRPVIFMVGQYSYDDMAQVATVTPFQSLNLDMQGLLGELSTVFGVPARPPKGRIPHHKVIH